MARDGAFTGLACYVQGQVKDMVWEVDEDLDEHVNWDEFSTMYTRNVTDKSGR